MNPGFNVLLHNLIIAVVLGLTVWIVQRWIRNPAVRHVLWVLVLLKLVTPPLWNPELRLLPAVEPGGGATVPGAAGVGQQVNSVDAIQSVSAKASGKNSPTTIPIVAPKAAENVGITGEFDGSPRLWLDGSQGEPITTAGASTQNISALNQTPPTQQVAAPRASTRAAWIGAALATVWGLGSLAWFCIATVRIVRFQRCLRLAQLVDEVTQSRTITLGQHLGLSRVPRVWFIPGRVSPMLWAFGRTRLIVPSELFTELDEKSQDALLLHELAHYRRGDHWVRFLELLAIGLYWWNPLVWLVRRELRTAEEQACDAWVVSREPTERRVYAEMLVKTLGFLSAESAPTFASGIGTGGNIEGRLTHIMRDVAIAGVSRPWKFFLFVSVALVLSQSPRLARAQREKNPTADLKANSKSEKESKTGTQETKKPAAPAKSKPAEENREVTSKKTENSSHEKEFSVTVYDELGVGVKDIDVTAYQGTSRIVRQVRTDGEGRAWFPQEWRLPGTIPPYFLIARDGDSRIGWWYSAGGGLPASKPNGRLRVGARLELPKLGEKSVGVPARPRLETKGKVDDGENNPQPKPADPVRIVLVPLKHQVTGLLVDGTGRPLSGVRVGGLRVYHPLNGMLNWQFLDGETFANGVTGADGRFATKVPADSQVVLAFRHPDWNHPLVSIEKEDSDLGTLIMNPAARVEGRVVDDVTGKPRARETVYALMKDFPRNDDPDSKQKRGRTDADGKYSIGGLAPGVFNIYFRGREQPVTGISPEVAPAAEGIKLVNGVPARVDFRVQQGRRLIGKIVTAESGAPVRGWPVKCYDRSHPASVPLGPMALTRDDGTFEFSVCPGACQVEVFDLNRSDRSSGKIALLVPASGDVPEVILKVDEDSAKRNPFQKFAGMRRPNFMAESRSYNHNPVTLSALKQGTVAPGLARRYSVKLSLLNGDPLQDGPHNQAHVLEVPPFQLSEGIAVPLKFGKGVVRLGETALQANEEITLKVLRSRGDMLLLRIELPNTSPTISLPRDGTAILPPRLTQSISRIAKLGENFKVRIATRSEADQTWIEGTIVNAELVRGQDAAK